MKLTSITIEYEKWGTEKGKYKGKVSFDVDEDIKAIREKDAERTKNYLTIEDFRKVYE